MSETTYINTEYMSFVTQHKDGNDKYRRIYNQLQLNNVGAIICSEGRVYVEGRQAPAYTMADIEQWVKRQGLIFLRI